MSRMCRKNGWAMLRMLSRIASHSEAVLVKRIEARVGEPCFVKMDAVHTLIQKFLYFYGVVAQPVVGTIRDNGVNGLATDRLLQTRMTRAFLCQCVGFHLIRSEG